MDLQLSGKTALVTGASAGIGTGIARALAEAGVRVAISGRNAAALDKVAADIAHQTGHSLECVAGDVAAKDGAAAIAESALAILGGRVDILVNNAGTSMPLKGGDEEHVWEESFALNFMAARRLAERLVPQMRTQKWGRVISISGALVGPKLNAASPAKAALVSWSRTLAFEVAADGVTVNTIAPGRINSVQILNKLHPTEQSRADYIKQNIPVGYFGEPQDIGHLAAFLASPLARYISGAAIPVDGGAVRLAM